MEQTPSTSSTALEYRRVEGVPRGPTSYSWLAASIVLATVPAMLLLRSGRAGPLVSQVTLILLGAGVGAACALIALRILRIRWWAVVLFCICVALSATATIGSILETRNLRGSQNTVLVPDITHALPIAGIIAGFAWVGALVLVTWRRGATFQPPRAKWAIMPLLILGWLCLSLENAFFYWATMMFAGSVVARAASPDERSLAVVERDAFLDTSYLITLQDNSMFALHARRLGGPSYDGAGPLGTPRLRWSADSRVIELRLGNDEPCFRYDTIADKELPAKFSPVDGRQ